MLLGGGGPVFRLHVTTTDRSGSARVGLLQHVLARANSVSLISELTFRQKAKR